MVSAGTNGTRAPMAASRDHDLAALAAQVERYTVRPVPTAGPTGAPQGDPDHVVVTLLDGDLAAAFEQARALARAHGASRLIAHGATFPSTWPSWVPKEPGLVLSELGAYRAGNAIQATSELRDRYRSWVEHVFAKAAPPGAAADIFYAPAVLRLFHAAFETQVFAGAIAALHKSSTLHLVGNERRALEDLVGLNASSLRSRARELALPPVLAAAWLASSAYTLRECVRMRLDARASLRELAARKAQAQAAPSLWVGVSPDWDRINKHLVDAGAKPELRSGRRLGVLLLGNLRSGMRDEQNLKQIVRSGELWPGLADLREELDRCSVDQAVQPRTDVDFVRAVAAAMRSSASVGLRMLRSSAPLRALARGGNVLSVARRAAATATLDVARSVLAERATQELIRDHDFNGRVVAFNASNAAGYTSVESLLRAAGAITLEHTHGSGGNAFYGGNESSAAYQCVWTEPDGECLAGRRKCVVAGMPQVLELRPRVPILPRRVLILSNYVHRDRPYAALPHEPFQTELLRVALVLREALGDELEFRWRPHPADEDAAVARGHATVPFVALSRGRTLAQDLDECDVLISGQSTALVEAALGDVPFFVQVIPESEGELGWVPEERRFFRAEEIVAPFMAWCEEIRRGGAGANDAADRAKTALFGASQQPRALSEAIAALKSVRSAAAAAS